MKVLFYYDQLSDPDSIAGGVCVVLRSLLEEFSHQHKKLSFVFSGNLLSKPFKIGDIILTPVSSLSERELKSFDAIVAVDRIGALRSVWQSLGGTKRFLYMHSWEIQEHPALFDAVVCLSESHRQWLSTNGITLEKISIIGNGVDFTGFIEEIDVMRKKHSLLSVGAIIEHKGTHILLEAAKHLKEKLPDLTLTILGSASLWNQNADFEKSLRSSAPKWVTFVDPVPRSSLARFYASHSIICSASKLETYGLVAVEAQGFGCIPVSFDVGGVSATMQDGITGRLYRPNAPEALCSALEKTFSDISCGVILREKAVQFARAQQNASNMAVAWINLLEEKVQPAKERSREQALKEGFSFCIITAGKRADKLQKLIDSIRNQGIEKFEIVVAGSLQQPIEGVRHIVLDQEAATGRVAVMRNRAMRAARYETIIMCDDDIVLDAGFADAIAQFGKDFNILCVKVRNPDGSRYWDWATVGGPTGHRLMSYAETDDFVYVSSSIFAITRKTLELGLFDEQRGFYQAEDVEFSQRLKAKGARIEICEGASALHDDTRYTQFDDYPRRICDFHSWEKIATGVEARGLYPWDGRAYPLSQEVQISLINTETVPQSFCFNVVALSADNYSVPWKCIVSLDGVPFAELPAGAATPWALVIEGGGARLLSLQCSDVAVGFCKGNYRDQRAVAAYLLKPTLRAPQSGDLSIPRSGTQRAFSMLDQSGISLFAPCMAFGAFAASARALVRNFDESNSSFGLELHSVDHWFSQLCFGFPSSSSQWTSFIKRRKYCGINLVCAEADKVSPGFFRRAQSSRRGFNQHNALTTATNNLEIIQELKAYDNVYVFDALEAGKLAKYGIYASVMDPQRYFPKGELINVRSLPNQRAQAVTILVDGSSDFESSLFNLITRHRVDEDVSIVIYVVDSFSVVQKIAKQVENYYHKTTQLDRMAQTVISSGTLEAIEELEFLRYSKERINLLAQPLAGWLDRRLSDMHT